MDIYAAIIVLLLYSLFFTYTRLLSKYHQLLLEQNWWGRVCMIMFLLGLPLFCGGLLLVSFVMPLMLILSIPVLLFTLFILFA